MTPLQSEWEASKKRNGKQRKARKSVRRREEDAQAYRELLQNVYGLIAGFQKGESPGRVNPEAAAGRQKLVSERSPEILASVAGWAAGREPDGDTVQTSWKVELLAERHGGLTPEGKDLSVRLKLQALKHLGRDGYLAWERKHKAGKVATLQLWAEEDKAKNVSSMLLTIC